MMDKEGVRVLNTFGRVTVRIPGNSASGESTVGQYGVNCTTCRTIWISFMLGTIQ
jgi:hypothetical protein